MARYRKVEVGVWSDGRFRAMTAPPPNGQTLWLYLLTGPRTTTFPGLVVAREAVMADDLGWSLEGFREAFEEALREGLVEADWKAGVVVLRKALLDSAGDPRETAKPESPNVLKSWAKSWDEVPDCDLKRSYLRQLGSFAEALGPGFAKAFAEAFRKALGKASPDPSPNQDQDQDQDQEAETPRAPARDPRGTDPAVAARQAAGRALWAEHQDARKRVAADLGVEALILPVTDGGRTELAHRLLEAAQAGEALTDTVERCRRALSRVADECRRDQTLDWLDGQLWRKDRFDRAYAKSASPPPSRASPRSAGAPIGPARARNDHGTDAKPFGEA